MRWHQALVPLWPAALVWLLYVFPTMVILAPKLRSNDVIVPLPWVLRAMLWTVEHTWPYSRLRRLVAHLDAALARPVRLAHPHRPASYYVGTQLELPFD